MRAVRLSVVLASPANIKRVTVAPSVMSVLKVVILSCPARILACLVNPDGTARIMAQPLARIVMQAVSSPAKESNPASCVTMENTQREEDFPCVSMRVLVHMRIKQVWCERSYVLKDPSKTRMDRAHASCATWVRKQRKLTRTIDHVSTSQLNSYFLRVRHPVSFFCAFPFRRRIPEHSGSNILSRLSGCHRPQSDWHGSMSCLFRRNLPRCDRSN
jgi:hypothetical protein